MRHAAPIALLALVGSLAACGGGGSATPRPGTAASGASGSPATGAKAPAGPPRTIDVPGDAATIQAAVDQATPGSLIRIAPGTYREAVEVPAGSRDLVLRGLDRNRVVLDGEDDRVTGIDVQADGVAVENLTVRDYIGNGLVFAPDPKEPGADVPGGATGADPYSGEPGAGGGAGSGRLLQGFRASYVTAINNGLYGIYAFASRKGVFDHLYASGHPDSGVYVGQCTDCDTLVTDSSAERNMVGYENTNASGVTVTRSTWRRNRVGVALNSQDKERYAPERDVVVTDNVVEDNDDPRTPRGSSAFGIGIVVAGGQDNRIAENDVRGHRGPGILVDTSLDGYRPEGNRVTDNRLRANGTDLALRLGGPGGSTSAPAALRNCFADNRFRRSSPAGIERRMPCPGGGASPAPALRLPGSPAGVDYRRTPEPGPQRQMPRAATAEAAPAQGLPDPAAVRAARALAGN